jgi:hypothetical protein
MPPVETPRSQIPIDEQASREAESKSHSMGSVMTALVATGLVATGTLVSTWVLILIGTHIQIHAAQNTDIRLLARQITWDDGPTIAAIAIFAATYLVIAIGKLPGYQLDRAGAALLGASLMVGLGIVSLDQAYRAIDFDTITLLLGMMIVVRSFRRGVMAGGHGGHRPHDAAHHAGVSSRVSDQRASSGCYDESGASQPISGQQVGSRDGRDDGLILCRPTGRQGGDRWRRAAAVHSQGQG